MGPDRTRAVAPAKEREREFNQAERLALHLSRATQIPVNAGLVRRVKPTETQTQLNRAERAGNVRAAFAPRGPKKLNGEKIVLLDDVLTTGATTSACARVFAPGGRGRCVRLDRRTRSLTIGRERF